MEVSDKSLPQVIHNGGFEPIKYARKQDRLDFMDGFLANEEDYTIDGNLTARAIEELIQLGRIDELKELLENAEEHVDDSE